MRFKTQEQEIQFVALPHHNAGLWVVLYTISNFFQHQGWGDPTITSIHRTVDDPYGLHNAWRAADMRIHNAARGDTDEVTLDRWRIGEKLFNKGFVYGKTSRGTETQIIKIRLASLGHHKDPLNDHAHVQVPRVGGWV